MQIKVTTDYAIRMVLYMAMHRGVISSDEMSKELKIPQSIILKIGRKLSRNGIAYSVLGVKGGVSLRKSAKDITVLDIINIFEPTTKINRCLETDEYCSRNATKGCPMRKFYSGFQNKVEEMFGMTTIHNLIKA